jgi:hypothetical protein
MDSTHTAPLDIPELSATAAVVRVFPDIANNSLISVGQLCNEGYSVTFTIDNVTIFNKIGKEILKGNRDLDTGLWCINLRKEIQYNTIASANNVYELRNTDWSVSQLLTQVNVQPNKSSVAQSCKTRSYCHLDWSNIRHNQ